MTTDMGASLPQPTSFDRAVSLGLAGQREQSLQLLCGLLEKDPLRAAPLLYLGELLEGYGEAEGAGFAFTAGLDLATQSGSLPLAIAALQRLVQLGVEVETPRQALALLFCRDSAALLGAGALPPAMTAARLSQLPPSEPLSGDGLLAHALGLAREAAELTSTTEGAAAPSVPRLPLFSSLDATGLAELSRLFEGVWVDAGSQVIEQGSTGAEAFVLARGELEVLRRSGGGEVQRLARLGVGTMFGEMALLSRTPRAASVVAVRPSLVLVVRADLLDDLVTEHPELGRSIADFCRRRMIDNLLRTSRVLARLDATERRRLVQHFVTRSWEEGARVVCQGDPPEGLHLIASGEVSVVVHQDGESTVLAKLGVGEVFGEMALVLRRPASADVVALVPTVTLHLPSQVFLDVMKAFPELLSELFTLAVERDQETSNVVAVEAFEVDDQVLV